MEGFGKLNFSLFSIQLTSNRREMWSKTVTLRMAVAEGAVLEAVVCGAHQGLANSWHSQRPSLEVKTGQGTADGL